MLRIFFLFGLIGAVAACTAAPSPVVPDFATRPYEPFNREDVVALALREWRLFGSRYEDGSPGGGGSPPNLGVKAERLPGLWQRVGEYWWLGLAAGPPEARWTGKHDQVGRVFPAVDDAEFAWSAAFISYVMRIAGAGNRFPYAPNHAAYVNAAAAGRSPILRARGAEAYAPQPGDLLCHGRGAATGLRVADLPTARPWPGHCAIVVGIQPGSLAVVGGNVDDAVEMTPISVATDGTLLSPDGTQWPIVLQVLYDANAAVS